jgi:hypothetical protein
MMRVGVLWRYDTSCDWYVIDIRHVILSVNRLDQKARDWVYAQAMDSSVTEFSLDNRSVDEVRLMSSSGNTFLSCTHPSRN